MPNTRFTFLLESTPLSSEDKYNLGIIFDALRDERKLDILSNWDRYVEKIILIQHLAEEEKRKQIQETFEKINSLIDEAYLRDQERKKFEAETRAQQDADTIAATDYDNQRNRERIIALEREQEESRAKLLDPLSFI